MQEPTEAQLIAAHNVQTQLNWFVGYSQRQIDKILNQRRKK